MEVLTVTLNPCIDRTLYVEKLEKNALVRSGEEFSIAGGKGANVARQLVRLGVKASAFVLHGGDSGNIYIDLVKRDGVRPIPYHVDQPTRWQMTFFEKGSDKYYTVLQEAKPVPRRHEGPIIEAIVSNLCRKDLLVLSGSAPGNGLSKVYRRVIEEAHSRRVRTVLDTYGRALAEGIKASPFMVKPNRKECEDLLGFRVRDDSDFRRAYAAFHEKGISLVVISLGDRGFRASFDGTEYIVPAPKVRTVNAVASGDALVAGIAYGMLRKLPIEEALRWGSAAGAANAAEWPVANCTKKSIAALLEKVNVKTRALKRRLCK
jgi:1-phosphofructokinase family hexose kinase